MNPLTLKILVVAVLTMSFLILIIFSYLMYKNYLRPLFIRLFLFKKVLKTMDVILNSAGDKDKKVIDLVSKGIKDLDLIKVAEQQILNSKKPRKPVKPGFNWWRKKDAKKKTVREVTGEQSGGDTTTSGNSKIAGVTGVARDTNAGVTGTNGGAENKGAVTIGEGRGGGNKEASIVESSKDDSRNAKQRIVQDKSVGISKKQRRHFN